MHITFTEIWKSLRVFSSNLHRHVFIFIVFPLVLGVLYGALYETFTATEVSMDPLTVYVSAEGVQAHGLLESIAGDLGYVELVPAAAADIRVLTAEKTASLGMVIRPDNQVTIIDMHTGSLEKSSFTYYMEQAAYRLVTTQSALDLASQTTVVEVQPKPKMSSRENMLTSAFTGVSLFLAFTLTGIFLKSREKRVLSRLMSVSLNKWELYAGNAAAAFIICLSFGVVYFMVSYRLILNLRLNLTHLALTVVLQSFFLAAVYGFLIAFFRDERTMRNVSTPFIMASMFLGGTIFPVDSFKGANTLAGLTPNYLLKNIYESLVTTNTFTVSSEVITLVVLSLVLLIGGAIRFSLREEV